MSLSQRKTKDEIEAMYANSHLKQAPSDKSLISLVRGFSDRVKNGRTIDDVLNHTMEELGELATEVKITNGKSYKQPGKDGIVGESIDIILCALDMIYIDNPSVTEEDILRIALTKCEKWERTNVG